MHKISADKHILRKDNSILLILLSFVFLYFYNLGLPVIWNPNEAFYAETPREMIEKGDFLTPFFNYEYRFEKPILTYWLVLPWYLLLGLKELAPRMVSAVAATLGVFITYWLGRTVWKSARAGLISGLLLAAAVDYNSLARYASTDMLLTVLLTASLALFFRGYSGESRDRKPWYLLFYMACGFATLTKGPVGIVVPLMVISVFLLIKREFSELRALILPHAVAAYLLIVLPWYLYMFYAYGNDFYSVIFRENLTRFGSTISGASNPFYYVSVIMWNFFPGSVFIIPAGVWVFRNIKKLRDVLYPLVWFLSIFIFFSMAKSKLPAYILSALPALAVLVGGWMHTSLEGEEKEKWTLLWLPPIILLLLLAGTLWAKGFLPDINPFFMVILVVLFAVSLFSLKRKTYYLSLLLPFAGMAVFNLIFLSDIMPQIEKYRKYRELGSQVRVEDPEKKLPFYCYKSYQQNLTFYLEKKILDFQDKEKEVEKYFREGTEGFLLLNKKTYDERYKVYGRRIIWQGLYYEKSESVFLKFLMAIKNKEFEEFVVIR